MKLVTVKLPTVEAPQRVDVKRVSRVASQNIPAFGVLEDEQVETEDVEDIYHSAQAELAKVLMARTERISRADQTLMDGVPTEGLAFENVDAAHDLALAEQEDWRCGVPQASSFAWELGWRLEEMTY